MRRNLRLGAGVVTASLVLVLLLVLRPLPSSRAVAIWILLVTALVLDRLVRGSSPRDLAGSRAEARFEAALRPVPPRPAVPAELSRLERELALGTDSAAFAHRRLLPRLRAVAEARLSGRRGIELERRPDEARELLGDDGWDLVRPDRPPPEDWNGPGVPSRRIEALIERLEAL